MESEARYQKFTTSAQAPVRLELALEGYFEGGSHREAYAAYLRRRIRPAAEALIAANEAEKLEVLTDWMDEAALEDALRMAREQGRIEAQVLLLQCKTARFGSRDRDLSL